MIYFSIVGLEYLVLAMSSPTATAATDTVATATVATVAATPNCTCDNWSVIEWTAQPLGAPDTMTCMDCSKPVVVSEEDMPELVSHKIMCVAQEHEAFDGAGLGTACMRCSQAAAKCGDDFRWDSIKRVMDGMRAPKVTAEMKAEREAKNLATMEGLLADLVADGFA